MIGPGKVPPAKVALGTHVKRRDTSPSIQTNLRENPSGAIILFAISSWPLVASMTSGESELSDLVRSREPGLDTRETASNERTTETRKIRDVNENACILSASRNRDGLEGSLYSRMVVEDKKFRRSSSTFYTLEPRLSS